MQREQGLAFAQTSKKEHRKRKREPDGSVLDMGNQSSKSGQSAGAGDSPGVNGTKFVAVGVTPSVSKNLSVNGSKAGAKSNGDSPTAKPVKQVKPVKTAPSTKGAVEKNKTSQSKKVADEDLAIEQFAIDGSSALLKSPSKKVAPSPPSKKTISSSKGQSGETATRSAESTTGSSLGGLSITGTGARSSDWKNQQKEKELMSQTLPQKSKTSTKAASPPNSKTKRDQEDPEKEQNFDFNMTEGQTRRTLMADSEFECTEIFPFLYLAGTKIAGNLEALRSKGITRIVNCCAAAVDSHFLTLHQGQTPEAAQNSDVPIVDVLTQTPTETENPLEFEYLSLNMVDGRMDDIQWFVCEVLHFIHSGREKNKRTLVHCEKGISRSSSYVISYIMWQEKIKWKQAFDRVKEKRAVINPNTAFTCNIIEIGELLNGDQRKAVVLLRLAWHLPHDEDTPVLKPLRHADTRKVLEPRLSLLDPHGIFVLRHGMEGGLYVWTGALAQLHALYADHLEAAIILTNRMIGVSSQSSKVTLVQDGREGESKEATAVHKEFMKCVKNDRRFDTKDGDRSYEDLYTVDTPGSPSRSTRTFTLTGTYGDKGRGTPPGIIVVAQKAPNSDNKPNKAPKPSTSALPALTSPSPKDQGNTNKPPRSNSSNSRTPTPTGPLPRTNSDVDGRMARTPSIGTNPVDTALIRGPTPVEDLKRNSSRNGSRPGSAVIDDAVRGSDSKALLHAGK